MSERLRELEKRLRDEPDNLGLRVTLAGALREAGRLGDAVELYRSVAIAYRDQGRTQQALAVCRSTLELVPGDAICLALLDALEPARRSSVDMTPLPVALPYHVADPTTRTLQKISSSEITGHDLRLPRPSGRGSETPYNAPRAESDSDTNPDGLGGLASAARQITASIDLAVELDTRKRPRIETGQLAKIAGPPPTEPMERVDLDDQSLPRRETPDNDAPTEEKTDPERSFEPSGAATRTHLLAGPLFAPLPADRRGVVLDRFLRRTVAPGTAVIRAGEVSHPFVLVARGQLDITRADKGSIGKVLVGDFYGEATLLTRAPAPAHVVAATECELLVLSARDFYEVAGAYPALWAALKDRKR